jgi:hypothetical protein
VRWGTSTEIALAGAATKLFATAGAGGIVLTVWGLRGLGVAAGDVAGGMVCYGVVVYAVYMGALAIAGYGLWLRVFARPSPVALTLIPAVLSTAVLGVGASMLFVDDRAERFLLRRAERAKGRYARWLTELAKAPRALHAGLLAASEMVRRRDRSLLGAVAYWGFDIGVLWASFHAFGHSPPGAVLVVGYFVGTLGNALPMPGGSAASRPA